jgi:hypothetical protein
MSRATPSKGLEARADTLMNSVPDDLQGLLRLLEEAGSQEEAWRRIRLPSGHLVRLSAGDDAEWRFRYGFKPTSVTLKTPATEKAILAALVALKGKPTKQPNRMRYVSRLSEVFESALSEGIDGASPDKFDFGRAWSSLRTYSEDPRLEGALRSDLRNVPVARLLKELLRQYRDDFDDLPEHKRAGLLEQAASHLNEFLEALRKLAAFLEAGDSTGGIPRTKLKVTQEQLRAAELADIVGLTHREIGDALGLPLTETDKRQGGHQKAKERVREGKKLLREAFGSEEHYSNYIEQQKQEAQRWRSLSTEQQYAVVFGESFGIPADSMLIIMTGDLEAAKAEVAKLGPEKLDAASFARATWDHWVFTDDPDSPLTPRVD